jgi:hypothetical protein
MFPVAATSYGLIKLSISDLFNTDVLYSPIACASSLSPVYFIIKKPSINNVGLTSWPTSWYELRHYSQQLKGKLNKYGFGESTELASQPYKMKAFSGTIFDKKVMLLLLVKQL